MNRISPFPLAALVAWLLAVVSAGAETTARLSSAFLARGEQAFLEVAISDSPPDSLPEIPELQDITIQDFGRGPVTEMLPGRRLEYVFRYVVTSYATGTHTIPPISVRANGVETRTEPIELEIFNPDQLQWADAESGGRMIRYASAFRTHNRSPYDNETIETEIKVYIPEDVFVEDWGIPDFERDGVAAWRFPPSARLSQINLLGTRFRSVAYASTITPTRVGRVSIGPAKIRLTTRVVIRSPYPQQVNQELNIEVPKLELDVQPLPEGAPAGFENAVGRFKLSASAGITELQEGDPLTVDLIVSGRGNLDTLSPPGLSETAGWKVYGTTTEQRGDERRQLNGTVVFHQTIRALEMKTAIPPYRFVYFDPQEKSYEVLTTEPIALRMTPGPQPAAGVDAVVQSQPVPFERMTDILATLRPARLTAEPAAAVPPWLVHAIGGLLALALIAKAWWMRLAPRFRKDPAQVARLRALREVESGRAAGDTEFLKRAGAFIERWLGMNHSPELAAVLAERDAVCFRSEKPDKVLDRKRRNEILRLLRRSALTLALLGGLVFSAPAARAQDTGAQALEAYESARYEDAARLWLQAGKYRNLTADVLYNIGNACYRGGSPGHAALYYRRAIDRDSSHQEARQNLRFIERKYGAITIQRPEFQYALARFPLAAWQSVCWTGVWLCVLALLVFPATRPAARLRVAAVGSLILGPIVASIGFLGWHYFPNDAEFAPVGRQAVIVTEDAVLHTDAARTAPEVIDAPPGSLCEVIRESGRWAYIGFATKTRGWIPLENLERIRPAQAPEPPKFKKPKGDGKSA